jgi:hypothetical protein
LRFERDTLTRQVQLANEKNATLLSDNENKARERQLLGAQNEDLERIKRELTVRIDDASTTASDLRA